MPKKKYEDTLEAMEDRLRQRTMEKIRGLVNVTEEKLHERCLDKKELKKLCKLGAKSYKGVVKEHGQQIVELLPRTLTDFSPEDIYEFMIGHLADIKKTEKILIDNCTNYVSDEISEMITETAQLDHIIKQVEFDLEQKDVLQKSDVKEMRKNYGIK